MKSNFPILVDLDRKKSRKISVRNPENSLVTIIRFLYKFDEMFFPCIFSMKMYTTPVVCFFPGGCLFFVHPPVVKRVNRTENSHGDITQNPINLHDLHVFGESTKNYSDTKNHS